MAPSTSYQQTLLTSLLVTLSIEIPSVYLIIRHGFRTRRPGNARILAAGVVASGVTLPLLWTGLTYAHSLGLNEILLLFLGEFAVFLAEVLIYRLALHVALRRAALLSFVANAASALLPLAMGLITTL
jgi:hypothetical protein